MLRMSRLTDYGTVVLAHLPNKGSSCVSAAEVAEASGLALPTVSKLLKSLAKAELVRSTRGAHGGYCLARLPQQISAAEVIDALAQQGVVLVGIDTPSIDLFAEKESVAHKACLRNDVAIVEGLVLSGVPAGLYELIAVPLKLVGFDASPVRALLREL